MDKIKELQARKRDLEGEKQEIIVELQEISAKLRETNEDIIRELISAGYYHLLKVDTNKLNSMIRKGIEL